MAGRTRKSNNSRGNTRTTRARNSIRNQENDTPTDQENDAPQRAETPARGGNNSIQRGAVRQRNRGNTRRTPSTNATENPEQVNEPEVNVEPEDPQNQVRENSVPVQVGKTLAASKAEANQIIRDGQENLQILYTTILLCDRFLTLDPLDTHMDMYAKRQFQDAIKSLDETIANLQNYQDFLPRGYSRAIETVKIKNLQRTLTDYIVSENTSTDWMILRRQMKEVLKVLPPAPPASARSVIAEEEMIGEEVNIEEEAEQSHNFQENTQVLEQNFSLPNIAMDKPTSSNFERGNEKENNSHASYEDQKQTSRDHLNQSNFDSQPPLLTKTISNPPYTSDSGIGIETPLSFLCREHNPALLHAAGRAASQLILSDHIPPEFRYVGQGEELRMGNRGFRAFFHKEGRYSMPKFSGDKSENVTFGEYWDQFCRIHLAPLGQVSINDKIEALILTTQTEANAICVSYRSVTDLEGYLQLINLLFNTWKPSQ